MDSSAAIVALGALAQESRLAVFRRLVELGGQGANPGALAAEFGMPANTLSFHLKTLAHAGLVTSEHSGRFVLYRVDFDRMDDLLAFLTRNCCIGDRVTCAPARACGGLASTGTAPRPGSTSGAASPLE